jgi:hypothetical protein
MSGVVLTNRPWQSREDRQGRTSPSEGTDGMKDEIADTNKRDGEQYGWAQAFELLLRFEKANGRPAASIDEWSAWASKQDFETPIRPSRAAYERMQRERVGQT